MTSFKDAYTAADKYVEERYGIVSTISDVIDPNTGDFDGTKIVVDYQLDAEQSLFVLLHLFGHTVQWCIDDELRKLGLQTIDHATPEQLIQVEKYEKDASRYGLQILHECGIYDMDRWMSDWWYADWCWLKHFYTTGEKLSQLDVAKWIKPGEAGLLEPLAIPVFSPKTFESRWAF